MKDCDPASDHKEERPVNDTEENINVHYGKNRETGSFLWEKGKILGIFFGSFYILT